MDGVVNNETVAAGIDWREVVDRLPAGVLVCALDRAVQAYNPAARRLLGAEVEREDVVCCDLLGCRRPGSVLEDHCVTERAAGSASTGGEVRVDVVRDDGERVGAWITATRLQTGDAVLIQLRSGQAGDRRRRTEQHWEAGRRLRIRALGRTRLETGEGPLAGEWLGHRPGEVLKYLICERGRIVALEELLEVFWPTAGRSGAANVRQAIHTLRDRLEPARSGHGSSLFIEGRKGGYEISREHVWIDADEFETVAGAGIAALNRGDDQAAYAALERAASLYGGDFLADEPYADWALGQRDRLRDLAVQILRGLAALQRDAGELETAVGHLQRLAELEPFDLQAQRDLLSLLIQRGRHSEALRRYDVVRRRWKRAFGEDPDLSLGELAPAAEEE
jgi:DNA-binding SARP family transcriptional activator